MGHPLTIHVSRLPYQIARAVCAESEHLPPTLQQASVTRLDLPERAPQSCHPRCQPRSSDGALTRQLQLLPRSNGPLLEPQLPAPSPTKGRRATSFHEVLIFREIIFKDKIPGMSDAKKATKARPATVTIFSDK